uniref:NADH-ubiquinone oxidoreductase chain 4 n=1 Tax=Lupocycloporus gracilimanus TaxID=412131 RepID=A0A3G5BTC3_9EUCA|nr:NADH dehydrogenase subunit 4 [Lupocycloporus gracilimanus]AYW03840.1 NADH dehydrogenase subunit 4 [Lupocycloporus gracilimanus]
MLKFIVPMVMLMKYSKEWKGVQLGMFSISFLVSISCYHNFFMFNSGFNLGMDYISYIMILLSVWIVSLILISSQKINNLGNFKSMFINTNILLLLFLMLTFSSLDYLMFYISFEASLIPTLILILGWGYQPERIKAGIYMLFYTLAFSLPLLVSLFIYYYMNGSLVINLGSPVSDLGYLSKFWYLSTIVAFLVKLPMFMFHLWLPKAHVEAPIAGSMILAGVLLKLGGYGLIRVLMMFQEINKMFCWLWVSFSIVGGIYISFMCLRQVDMKSLIAYSSVVHMSLVLCGVMIFSWWGLAGSVILMVGHGLCSSGLFCLANMVYERTSSRSFLVNKGLLSFMPSMGLWWFLLSVSNMASPPSLNLMGEVMLILTMLTWSKILIVGISLLSFFSASYTLYMYSLSQHGVFFSSLYSCCSGKVVEYLSLFLHWFPLNFMILNSSLLMI